MLIERQGTLYTQRTIFPFPSNQTEYDHAGNFTFNVELQAELPLHPK